MPGELADQLKAVAAGTLDRVLLLSTEGSSDATLAVRDRGLHLVDLPWTRDRAVRHPYVRSVRLPGAAYHHQQARAENTFYRYKRSFGRELRARREDGQRVEVLAGCIILNKMFALGRPHSGPIRR